MKHDRSLVRKVLAYIIPNREGRWQLLVNVHRDFPEAGVQVPAGTWEDHERADEALLRQIQEETGLGNVRLVTKLAQYTHYPEHRPEVRERHVFLAKVDGPAPDRWKYMERFTGGSPVILTHYWVDLCEDLALAGGQRHSVDLARQFVRSFEPRQDPQG